MPDNSLDIYAHDGQAHTDYRGIGGTDGLEDVCAGHFRVSARLIRELVRRDPDLSEAAVAQALAARPRRGRSHRR